jgi:putative ABC transport system permease protein
MFGYLAIALLLIGTLMLMPRISSALLDRLPAPRMPAIELALAQLRGAAGQAAVSLAAIVASVSLMVSMAIMVASFRHSVDEWLERLLPADAYVRVGAGDTAYLTPDDQTRVIALSGIRRVEFQRETQVLLDPARPRVALLARHVDAADPQRSLPLIGAPIPVAIDAPPAAWVSEAMVDLYGAAPGTRLTLPLAGKAVAFTVAGVWRDYARQWGAIAIERARYVALTGDATVTHAALWLAPGTTPYNVRRELAVSIPGGDRLEFAAPGEIRAASLAVFDRTFAVTHALELAAVLIGLVGMSAWFAALVLARRREFGVLRHIGMTRRRVAAMLAAEGFAVSGIGLLVGMTLGALISLVLIHVVNRQSFRWGMELSLPWATLAGFALAILVLATLSAVASGRHAMGPDVVRAVKDDW